MKNVVILTNGRTGSSILAGLLSQNNRYWINKDSIQKRKGYPLGDFENPELRKLNESLLTQLGYPNPALHYLKGGDIKVGDLKEVYLRTPNLAPYQKFADMCEMRQPWLWKDPRLAYTIFFWANLLKNSNVQYINIKRDIHDIFLSLSKNAIKFTKGEVYHFTKLREEIIELFFIENRIEPLQIDYQDLWDRRTLNSKISPVLGLEISKMEYDGIVQKNIKKKEPKSTFLMRYAVGLAKLKLKRSILNQY